MAEADAGEKLKVFISYSRKDSAEFADELLAGLEVAGFAPFLDRHDIVPGERWEARLGDLIEQSDTVVFVVSPEAVKSERCVWEVDRTIGLSSACCRLFSSLFRSMTSLKSSGGCNSSASTAGQDLRGHCRSSPRRCGSTFTGYANTRGWANWRHAGMARTSGIAAFARG
jgi:hypothetical protein